MSNFLNRSWLFEIVDSETKNIDKSFTLILPPNSVVIREPQRVSITKTFKGRIVDDYGPDDIEIELKAISGTASLFPTFRTTGTRSGATYRMSGDTPKMWASDQASKVVANSSEGYDARNAFYTFRDEIIRYKDTYPDSFEKKELWVYDLADEQVYKCILTEFQLHRESSQPHRYPFSIKLHVIDRPRGPSWGKISRSVTKRTLTVNPEAAARRFQEKLDVIDKMMQDHQDIIDKVAIARFNIRLLLTQYGWKANQVATLAETPLNLIKLVLGSMQDVMRITRRAWTRGKLTIYNYTKGLEVEKYAMKDALGLYTHTIHEGQSKTRQGSIEVDPASEVFKITGDGATRTRDKKTYRYTGLKKYDVRSGDTLQRIAQREMGNIELWPYISSVNGIGGNADLVPGKTLYLPVFKSELQENMESYIIAEDTHRDPYGTDIRVVDGKVVIAENNDLATISGVSNVEQSVDLRVKTARGSMVKQTTFGLIGLPGIPGTDIAYRYLRMNLRSALLDDPRINDVRNIRLNLSGDTIRVDMDIYVVDAEDTLSVTTEL